MIGHTDNDENGGYQILGLSIHAQSVHMLFLILVSVCEASSHYCQLSITCTKLAPNLYADASQ